MASPLQSIRRNIVASLARARGVLPHAVNDAVFHLPTRATADTPALSRASGWQCTELGPRTARLPAIHAFDAPAQAVADAIVAGLQSPTSRARAFAAVVPHGRVYAIGCTAIAPPGIVLADVSPHAGVPIEQHRVLSGYVIARPPRRIAGTCALIAAVGHDNFYHWLFDSLPRIGLVRDAGLAAVDHWIVPDTSLAVAKDLLARCGIDPARVVTVGAGAHIECERLIVTSAPGEICEPTPRSVEFLRGALGASASPSTTRPRRIYVARRGRRKVANEGALAPILVAHGIETVAMEGLSLDAQIAAFRGASLVVAPHGAALAHLIHAQPDGTLVELMPPAYGNPSFLMLAGACGMRYTPVAGMRIAGRGGKVTAADFEIDPAGLERALRGVVGS